MKMRRVRAGSVYKYEPVMIDQCNPPHGAKTGRLIRGTLVRVVNLPGCPKANTMGHCHVEDAASGEFLGLVCTNSLSPSKR